jgi:hypothetical protein
MLEKVNTIKELAFFLSVRESELVSLNPERLYFSFKISKKHSNEKRLIEMRLKPYEDTGSNRL